MTLRLLPHPSARTATEVISPLGWICKPHKIFDGVLAARDRSGRWTELSGLDEWTLNRLLKARDLTELSYELPSADLPAWQKLLSHLAAAGLIENPQPRPTSSKVQVIGDGALADIVRARLCQLETPVTVVCADRLEPDRGLLRQLATAGEPYLLVRADQDWATIGPYVAPGTDGGLCCLDQHNVDDDPTSWQLLLGLSRIPAQPADWLADWVVGQLQAQLRSIASGSSRLVNASVSMNPSGEELWTTWQPHPMCCGSRQPQQPLSLANAA